MKILVTGANGFVGKNLVLNLYNIKEGKNKTRDLKIEEIFQVKKDTEPALFDAYCKQADFVFHLAWDEDKAEDTMSAVLLETLKKYENTCPVMFASSIEAVLAGPYARSEYGKGKHEAEELFFQYEEETGAKVLVYRFTGIFGKWCRPDHISTVATLCSKAAQNLPISIEDRNKELELIYIDDLVTEMLDAMEGKEHHCEYFDLNTVGTNKGKYCHVPVVHKATLGRIEELLKAFQQQPKNLMLPDIPSNSFEDRKSVV